MSDDLNRLSLKDAINGLRRQIKEAAQQAQGLAPGEIKFRITQVELELTVVAEDSTTAGGEVGWWVFKAKADVGAKDATTHKLKLNLDVGDIAIGTNTLTK